MTLYKAARKINDGKAILKTVQTGSIKPIFKRLINKIIGRFINKLWVR